MEALIHNVYWPGYNAYQMLIGSTSSAQKMCIMCALGVH